MVQLGWRSGWTKNLVIDEAGKIIWNQIMERLKCQVQKNKKCYPSEPALRWVVQLCPLSVTPVEVLAVSWRVPLILVRAPDWSEAQHWDKQGRLVFLLSSVFRPELGGTGALLLCLLEVSGSQINESWKNLWNHNPKYAPLHLVLWKVLEMFLWWSGASENLFVCRNIHTLCREAMLPAERRRETGREREA